MTRSKFIAKVKIGARRAITTGRSTELFATAAQLVVSEACCHRLEKATFVTSAPPGHPFQVDRAVSRRRSGNHADQALMFRPAPARAYFRDGDAARRHMTLIALKLRT